ncbi:MAG: N-acetylmuramoyl-L-alanine amidase [Prevotellaceae bacterium]|jgi:N-acetylmuramoyl-L-alanine amidase|nr:N-acetylmuramoyl-L-alanine amidase [Prevotellaceae bacterium]
MRKLIIIAGHNGKGTGAPDRHGLDEGAETMALRDCFVDWLRIKYPQIEVATDRGRDNLTLAGGLLKWLKSFVKKSNICIDLHFNSSANEQATGAEVVVPDKYSMFEFGNAKKLAAKIAEILQIKNRGVKIEIQSALGKLAMLSEFDCENFLIEFAFTSNAKDVENYKKYKPELIAGLGEYFAKMALETKN